MRPVTSRQIKAIVKFLPKLEAIDRDDIVRLSSVNGAVFVVGCVPYHPTVHKFERACYANGFVQPFDWPAWGRSARRYIDNPRLIDSAKLSTCIRLITTHVRTERFGDGHLEVVLKSGHIMKILKRLEVISRGSRTPDEMPSRSR